MEKVIKIGGKEVRLSNNIAWTMEYRDQFNKDIVPVIMPLFASFMESVAAVVSTSDGELTVTKIAEAIEGRAMEILIPAMQVEFVDIIINITWAMAKAADENILPPKQWARQFDAFHIDIVAPAIYDLALKGLVSSKNLKRLKNIRVNLQPLTSMTSSSQGLSED